MKTSQSVVTERLHQALNEHDLEALLACFVPDFQGNHPRHPDRGIEGIEQVRKSWSIIFQDVPDFHAEFSVRQLRGTQLGLSGTGSAPVVMVRSLGCAG